MAIVTSLSEKRRHKQIEFEQQMLRELTYSQIEASVSHYFAPFFQVAPGYLTALEEMCIDYTIEAYLLGASYGKFGYFGETMESVRQRSAAEEKRLVDDLFDYWNYWTMADEFILESLYRATEALIRHWWEHGFHHGKKRYALRRH